MQINFKRALILAPHTDDGEFGCGGTIARLIENGCECFYTAFSVCEQSVPYGFKKDQLEHELYDAMSVLGIKKENIIVHRFEVRHFPEHRQKILQKIIDYKQKINPDIVFLPSPKDMHQDHQVISAEGLRAYKNTNVLAYEVPWNNLNFNTAAFIEINQDHLIKKINALKCYKTQEFRHYASPKFIESLAMTRGVQIGCDFAEVFEPLRMII